MIKVFIIDDSIVVRNSFKRILSGEKEIEIIGTAVNPIDAMSKLKEVGYPDVFILDIIMPKMDGLTYLRLLFEERPTPVIICSILTVDSSEKLLGALGMGVTALIEKPKTEFEDFLNEYKSDVIEQIKAYSKVDINHIKRIKKIEPILGKKKLVQKLSNKIIAIGSSTGGVPLLDEILSALVPERPSIVIVQHMPKGFTGSFAKRLNKICKNSLVVEAKDNDVLKQNNVYIAPGDKHIEIIKENHIYVIKLKDFPRVDFHKPSATVLLDSVSKVSTSNAMGFILTGMGTDGAKGLLKMRQAGSKTYSLNEESSLVYGMPKAAVKLGASMEELSVSEIIQKINEM